MFKVVSFRVSSERVKVSCVGMKDRLVIFFIGVVVPLTDVLHS